MLPSTRWCLLGAARQRTFRSSAAVAMDAFTTVQGVAAPMDMPNVDTDMIYPAQFLKTIQRTGLGNFAFHDLRFDGDGAPKDDFVLNAAGYKDAIILVTGENFGCGSSREHAPWALLDLGIRCIISTSFADIFFNNCMKNGILPIMLAPAEVEACMADAKALEHLEVCAEPLFEGPPSLSAFPS